MATKVAEMSAVSLIETLDVLNATINGKVSRIADETVRIVEQWDGLVRVGGQRDDHAADLLANLLPGLRELARFAGHAVVTLEEFKRNPFGR